MCMCRRLDTPRAIPRSMNIYIYIRILHSMYMCMYVRTHAWMLIGGCIESVVMFRVRRHTSGGVIMRRDRESS
ncbi:hypothetical protein CSUI_010620 [Cystoisospora suis]|uniref:Uncharacterized protein n=1 Tax=Cystoisospora suis TaxID=483139 RepID=A0A2C6JA90_9APIC|nr:hypothetical protein CSUI_010620 [Cystoisospora suis]